MRNALSRVPKPVYAALTALAIGAGFWISSSPGGEGPGSGEAAPPFSLADLSGVTVSLSERRGKVVLIDFWATWCDSCAREAPGLKALDDRLRGRAFELLAVAIDDGPQAVAEFAAEEKPGYTIVFGDSAAAKSYGVWALPTKYLIDSNGRVYRKYIGEADLAQIESDIQHLLARKSA